MRSVPSPCALCLLLVGLPAAADPPAPRKGEATVTITAKGYESPLAETAAAVSVLRLDPLSGPSVSTLAQALGGLPGITWAGDGGLGLNPVLRGLKREQVVLLVDGIKVEALQPVGALAGLIDPALLEGVEVVQGPVSVLQGSGAMGGAVHLSTVVPDGPRDGRWRGGVRLGTSEGDGRRTGSLQLKVGVGAHAFALAASQGLAHDYDTPKGEVPYSGFRQRAAHLAWRWDMAAATRATLRLQRDESLDLAFPGSRQARPAGGEVLVRSPRHARSLASLALEHGFGGAWSPLLRVQVHHQAVDRSLNSYVPQLDRDISMSDVSFAARGVDLRLEAGQGPWRGLVGLAMGRMEASPDSRSLAADGSWNRVGPYRDGRLDSLGGFLQGEWQGAQLGVTAGLRWDEVDGSASAIRMPDGTYRPSTAAGLPLDRRDGAWSGSLGVTWKALEGLVPYVALSRAFRAPDLRERFQSGVRPDGYTYQGNPQLQPEYARHLEAGLKGAGGRWSWQVAAFETRLTDLVAGRTVSPTVRVTENIGRARLRGVDGQVQLGLPHATRLGAFAGWVKGDNLVDAEPLYQTPPLEGGFLVEHRPGQGWSGRLRWRLVARQERVATRFTAGRENATPGFSTLDAAVGWSGQRTDGLRHAVDLEVQNGGNRAYREHLTEGLAGREILAPGRRATLTWSMRF